MRDKEGNYLTFKEFMSRWKKGIEGITPLQQANIQLRGINISLLGLVLGIVVTIIGFDKLWWVMIILVGATINTIASWIGVYQKKKAFEKVEEVMKGGLEE